MGSDFDMIHHPGPEMSRSRVWSLFMADFQPTPPTPEPQDEIRALLIEIRRQNVVQTRYLCILGGGLTLLLLIQSDMITTILNYAIIVVIVMVVMLTAPMWSRLVVAFTNSIPWFPKRKNDRP